jgi:hypothetical protein
VTEPFQVDIEFVGGPYDGKVIGVPDPGEAAPRYIQMMVDPPSDYDDWPEALSQGAVVDRYRAPAPGVETDEAAQAYGEGRPVKYRYAGRMAFNPGD